MEELARNNVSTWKNKWKALGPGILMASAAVGGSHIIASTQAGALFGWQLIFIVILANLFKYPFFRFAYEYTLNTENTILDGYRKKSRHYVTLFFILNIFATIINTAAVLLLSASILKFALSLPDEMVIYQSFTVNTTTLMCILILVVCYAILLLGRFAALSNISKLIMISLSVTTIIAASIALKNNGGFVLETKPNNSPWNIASVGFIVALMGWMPAPIEISAVTSLWVKAKKNLFVASKSEGLFDFNVGYIGTSLLALVFLALGALVQYSSSVPVEMTGGKYIAQLIGMYSSTIGQWSHYLVAFIAFACMFGTTITVLDGYNRTNVESIRLMLKQQKFSTLLLNILIVVMGCLGMVVILFFKSSLGSMLNFAMIASFVSAPIFAWLNLSLVKTGAQKINKALLILSWIGLAYLTLFTLFFLFTLF